MTTRRALLPLVLLLAACGFFSRTKSRYYTLDRIPPTGAVASVTGAPIAIDVVELPPGVDRREMIVHKADQQLDVRTSELWSAPLEASVLHTLAFDLADRLPEGMVILPGQAKPLTATRSISLVIEDLAAGPENRITLDARWILDTTSHHERIAIDISALDGKSIASGVSQALATLADRMVAQLGVR
jgi:uncharacterized lipoprotein YmbA